MEKAASFAFIVLSFLCLFAAANEINLHRTKSYAAVSSHGKIKISKTAVLSNDPQRLKIWPQPLSSSFSNASVATIIIPQYSKFDFDISFPAATAQESDVIQQAVARYKSIIFYDSSVPSDFSNLCNQHGIRCINKVQISIQKSQAALNEKIEEGYKLSISETAGDSISISSQTVWGALRALETLSQVISKRTISQAAALYAVSEDFSNVAAVTDAPRFKWRGILVDTARHYLSVSMLKKIIDALSYIKMNVLHWHVSDAQSFPFEVPNMPEFAKARYAPEAYYSDAQVADIVKYAYLRGVRVIFEIDLPGHSYAFGLAYPELVAKCPSYEKNINNIPLNPAVPRVYDMLKQVVDHISSLSLDPFLHFGADELVTGCWKQDDSITEFMKQQHFTTYEQLLMYFEKKLQAIYTAPQNNKTMICWEELVLNNESAMQLLPKQTVVQVWTSQDGLLKVARKGFRAILSAGWYLDKQKPGSQSHWFFMETWHDFYLNEPFNSTWTQREKDLVLGGEAAMWAEQVDDANFESRVFPRVLAIAERLWSPETVNIIDKITYQRLEKHRCNLVRRGIRAGPVMPGYCDAAYGN